MGRSRGKRSGEVEAKRERNTRDTWGGMARGQNARGAGGGEPGSHWMQGQSQGGGGSLKPGGFSSALILRYRCTSLCRLCEVQSF